VANYERGVYEPRDEARDGRVYDASEDEDDVEGSRLPLLIVLALLVLAMFGGVVWLAYTQGVARGRGETPVLTAANGPERVAPPQGGGTVPYQGFKIYEQPAPPDDSAEAPAAAPKSEPAPVAAAPKPAPAPVAAAPKPAPAPPPVVAKPAPSAPSAAPPKSVAALIQQANSAPPPAKPPAAAKPAAPPPAVATAAPRPLAPPVTAAPAVASGALVLQIGSYKSQAEAENAWKLYKAKHAALLSGYSDNIQQVDLGEKGSWYRLRIGGFSDKEVATALCDRLKADGGACIPGR
jgi:hypothetical protein